MEGKDLVVEGPPGTGKSQTIANLIGHSPYPIVRLIVPEVDIMPPIMPPDVPPIMPEVPPIMPPDMPIPIILPAHGGPGGHIIPPLDAPGPGPGALRSCCRHGLLRARGAAHFLRVRRI